MTHSHDTATPALSVESEYVLVPREPTPEMSAAGFKHWAETRVTDPTLIYRAMIAAAPAHNPSPAAKDGEAVVVPYDDFHAAYGFVPRSKVSPDRCLKTRLRALLRAEDLAHADEAEALATPSPQPAEAVRTAIAAGTDAGEPIGYLKPETPYAEGSRFIYAADRTKDWMMSVFTIPVYSRPLAALASDPAPAGEAVEPTREAHPQTQEIIDALDFYDRVVASSDEERIAVGTDHWTRLLAAVRAFAARSASREGASDE